MLLVAPVTSQNIRREEKGEESIALATNLRRYLDMDTHRRKDKMESVMAEFHLAALV